MLFLVSVKSAYCAYWLSGEGVHCWFTSKFFFPWWKDNERSRNLTAGASWSDLADSCPDKNLEREVERRGRKSIETQQQIHRRKKKKAEIISCLRSSAWFILRLRNCAVDFTMFTALKQKRNAWQGYIWKHPAPWVLLESVGNRVLSLAHAPAEVVCHLVVVRFQLLLELVCTGDCLWHLVVSPSGTAPKCTAVMLWSPSIFRLESAMSIILDKDFLLKQKSWLIILTRWAGVNGLITSFLDSVKSRRKLEKRAWRKANTIYVKGK